MERRFAKDSPGRSTPWMKDPTARAWLLETMNNRPAYAYTAAKGTLRADQRAGADPRRLPRRPRVGDPRRLRGAGRAGQGRAHHRQDPAGGALRRTGRGAGPVGVRRLGPAPVAGPATPATTPATGAKGTELVGDAATVLPPAQGGHHRVRGRWRRSAPPASCPPRCACSSRPGTATPNALTNLAFWAAHPELFGTKLQPSQPGFAQLSAEWIRLRDGIVRAAHSASSASPGTTTAPTTTPATQPAPGTVPADVVAAESPPPRVAGATQAGSGDKYFAQGAGHYRTSPTRARRPARSASGSTGRPARTSAT